MPSSYSLDLRRRVMADVASGLSIELVGRKYSICSRVIFQWRDLLEETRTLNLVGGKPGRNANWIRTGIRSFLPWKKTQASHSKTLRQN